jgi:hypothetical protein
VCARGAWWALLGGPSTSPLGVLLEAVVVDHVLAYFWLIAYFATQGTMLWMQVSALRRHQEISFFLLSVSTSCGLLYLFMHFVVPNVMPPDTPQPGWYYPTTSLLLLGQMALGVWGTARLFRMYGMLRSTVDTAAHRRDA